MNKFLMRLINNFGFTVAVLVQIAIMSVSMSLLGYQILIKIGFVLIGLVVVLFAVRAWVLGNRILWGMFALVSIFFSWSFALVGTDTQTKASVQVVTVESDNTLRIIQAQLSEARKTQTRLTDAYNQAGRGETVDSILEAQKENSLKISQLEEQERDRLNRIETGTLSRQAQETAAIITADRIFSAIPDAIKGGRIIQFIIFGLIFIGLEITIITAVKEEQKNPPQPEKKKDLIKEYARIRWSKGGAELLPRMETIGEGVPAPMYQKITEYALRTGLLKTEKGGRTIPMVTEAEFVRRMKTPAGEAGKETKKRRDHE